MPSARSAYPQRSFGAAHRTGRSGYVAAVRHTAVRVIRAGGRPGYLGHQPGGVLLHAARCLAAEGRQLRLMIADVTLTRLHGYRAGISGLPGS
jgi:hypothetical protein